MGKRLLGFYFSSTINYYNFTAVGFVKKKQKNQNKKTKDAQQIVK